MRALTQVGDARVLGIHLVGGTQGGADLGDERLWELLAVELLRAPAPQREWGGGGEAPEDHDGARRGLRRRRSLRAGGVR